MDLFHLLFPAFCVGCNRIGATVCKKCLVSCERIPETEMICPVCEKRAIDGITHPKCRSHTKLDGLISLYRYHGVIRNVIKETKYRYARQVIQDFLGKEQPIQKIQFWQCPQDIVVIPVPLHPSRFRQRGFNQAELIAKEFSRQLAVPLLVNGLVRSRPTNAQAGLIHRDQRIHQMHHAFLAVDHAPKSILLVDDVFTTGATMHDAARALKRAGATTVFGATIAR